MLRRRAVLELIVAAGALGLSGARAADGVSEESWSAGGLHGAFARPADGTARGPAVLILAGSGPTDRDGNQNHFATNTYRLLAHGLAAAGIRSLRYDKRGVGASRALMTREQDVRFVHFVDDAVSAIKNLSERPDISTVVVTGHSEGALVAIQAAARVAVGGLVLLESPGGTLADLIRFQLGSNAMAPELRRKALAILDRLVAGEAVADVPAPLAPLLRPSAQPYLMSILSFEPAAALGKLAVPVMLVQGERDIQVSRADYDALIKARPDARGLLLPTANHALKPAPADRDGNIKAYTDRSLALDPAVVPAIAAFVGSVAKP